MFEAKGNFRHNVELWDFTFSKQKHKLSAICQPKRNEMDSRRALLACTVRMIIAAPSAGVHGEYETCTLDKSLFNCGRKMQNDR